MENFNFEKVEGIRIQNKKNLKKHNPSKSLKNSKKVQKALLECIAENDLEAFREILLGHIEASDKESIAKLSGVSLRTIYRMLEKGSNPTIKNVSAVINALSKAS